MWIDIFPLDEYRIPKTVGNFFYLIKVEKFK